MKIYVILLLVLICRAGLAQNFKGRIFDSKSNQPLSYSNIGVKGKMIGGIADNEGRFSIDISKTDPNDRIIVSYIGYEPQVFTVKELILKNDYEVKLSPGKYQLNTVVISYAKKPIILGNNTRSSIFTGWGRNDNGIAKARGMVIEPKEFPVKLNRFFIHIRDNSFDSVRFRLHILTFDKQANSKHLSNENIFFTTSEHGKWVSVDISKYNIVISTKIIVAVEWVDAWGKTRNPNLGSNQLTFSMSRKDGYFYIKETPEGPFHIKFSDKTPSMYFECFQVGEL